MNSLLPFPPTEAERRRKGIFFLPNLFTLTSLFLGFYSLLMSIEGEFERAALAILGGAIFDMLDGMVARATRTQSQFGQELDSLVDAVTFGVAPGILILLWALMPFEKLGISAGFFYIASTLLRLARFNVQAGSEERLAFQGLPSPGGGGVIATTVLMYYYLGGEGHPSRHWLLLALCYGIAFLMISRIPYPSSKAFRINQVFSFSFLIGLVLMASILIYSPIPTLFFFSLLYALSGPLLWLRRAVRRTAHGVKSYVRRSA